MTFVQFVRFEFVWIGLVGGGGGVRARDSLGCLDFRHHYGMRVLVGRFSMGPLIPWTGIER